MQYYIFFILTISCNSVPEFINNNDKIHIDFVAEKCWIYIKHGVNFEGHFITDSYTRTIEFTNDLDIYCSTIKNTSFNPEIANYNCKITVTYQNLTLKSDSLLLSHTFSHPLLDE